MESEKRFACQLKKYDGPWKTVAYFFDLTAAKMFLDGLQKRNSTAARIQNTLTDKTEYEIVKSK